MKKVTLMRYWLQDRDDLPKSYVKQAERQLEKLSKLIGPGDKRWNYMKEHRSGYRTIYQDLVAKKYQKLVKASSSKQQA